MTHRWPWCIDTDPT